MPQLRHPTADVLAFGVELGGLSSGIEDAQRLGIHAAAGTPLPTPVIGSQIAIHLQLHEGTLAPAPLQERAGKHDLMQNSHSRKLDKYSEKVVEN